MRNKNVTNGGAPGISAAFLNALEAFLTAGWFDSLITSDHAGGLTVVKLTTGTGLLSLAAKTQSLNGSTSGTMTVYEFLVGANSLKAVLCNYNNYKNAAASANTIALNAAFTLGAHIFSGNCQGTQFLATGTPQNIGVITTWGGVSDGASTSQNKINTYSVAEAGAFDSISEPGSNAATRSGHVLAVGI